MAAVTQMRNTTDDAVSIDSMAAPVATAVGVGGVGEPLQQQPMVLSKKALHQRDADENLFLRFLELDPPGNEVAQNTPSGRRLSNSKPIGRTPFTMTKKLTRTAERGFGFSIVWTHPPRVEKVEPGLSADRCGILPGDYVIFVDKHNVVTMPEADVLNLIRSQGATLTLEIFRGSGSGTGAAGAATGSSHTTTTATATTHRSLATTMPMNGKTSRTAASGNSINNVGGEEMASAPARQSLANVAVRPPTACSGGTVSSMEAAKRRLNLPQVTFSKESIAPITDNRRRFLLQLISREQNFMSALHFGTQRFIAPLQERKDLITPNDHRTLFQNMDELLRISEDILEQLCHDDQEPPLNFASRVYLSKTTAICAAYKKYCNGIKRADCVLVNKSRQTGSEFVSFITEPPVPRKRPDLTMFIHRPLQHFREILKLMQLLASNCHVDTEEHKNFNSVINELQAAYREITVSSGLMEPLGEGRPLLTLQDLESRMVFTKCKPFTLAVQGRQWIFGGDLSRVEGRSVKPYWTLLFSDIIVFAKVSRDRVLFITEEPIPIANIVDSCFHMRKKTTEFRITVDPNGRLAESPTGYCAPDLSKTPKKGARRKSLVLRAPSLELKAVWQNLLQRQIFLVNAALGSTPLSSPLDSPDVLNTLVPLSDIGIASASIGSIKLSSMDSINLKNQQHSQQNHRVASHHSEQIEKLIDEKCRILNKTGTSKSSALHLANWMKGQLDKQQEQARLAVFHLHSMTPNPPPEESDHTDNEQDERITYWTRQQLEKRTKELNLAKEHGSLSIKPNFGGKRLSGVEELSMSDVSHSEAVSQISQSHSTTSDSQITVRSSPIVLDKLAVCRHCHKNCQKNNRNASASASGAATADHFEPSHQTDCFTPSPTTVPKAYESGSGLVCNSLKVQHSQSSPHRCCKLNGSASRASSVTSISSGTVTGGEKNLPKDSPSSHAHQDAPASSSKYETESDVALLLSDDTYASETPTVDETPSQAAAPAAKNGGAQEVSSSTTSSGTSSSTTSSSDSGSGSSSTSTTNAPPTNHSDTAAGGQRLAGRIDQLRILDEHNEALILTMNGHCQQNGTKDDEEASDHGDRQKPEPPPRKFVTISPQKAKESQVIEQHLNENDLVTMSVTITETAKIVKIEQTTSTTTTTSSSTPPAKSPRSPRSPRTPLTPKSDRSAASSTKSRQFVPCSCKCLPEDFANTTLSPEEVELQTCRIRESPKQTPKMPRLPPAEEEQKDKDTATTSPQKQMPSPADDPHKYCQCTCGRQQPKEQRTLPPSQEDKDDDDLSLMLIGLAQLTPAAKLLNMKTPTAPLPTPTQTHLGYAENGFVPTIAIVPATPDSVLTKTSTHVWDNSSSHITTSTATTSNLMLNNVPRQAIVENIPEDSCDESPLDEEPPYRPMSNALRRYGTMSSLEKLPSEDHLENDYECDDDDDDENDDDLMEADDDDDDDELMDKARADNIELDNEIRVVTKAIYSNDEAGSSANSSVNAWSSRASNFVSGKMSFFEESRAFIDKYLGRWNQDQGGNTNAAMTSDPEEQMDECTSGATSGEEVWGTPTSGGDNDEMHMANSENTHSSPTKSSNSLNDDDDTELMMDELLMAPPMSASTIRGLLPRFYRRRLEPLFEEETESDEEKTQQESEELKKGETTTNGHYLEDSQAGSSSEEEEEEDEENLQQMEMSPQRQQSQRLRPTTAPYSQTYEQYEAQEEEEDPPSMEERLQPNLQTTILGPRPLSYPMAGPTQSPMAPPPALKASSCEYLLEQRLTASATTSHMAAEALPICSSSSSNLITMPSPTCQVLEISAVMSSTLRASSTSCTTIMATSTPAATTTTTTCTTIISPTATAMATATATATSSTTMTTMIMRTSCSLTASITPTTPSPAAWSASTTTSSASATTRSASVASSCSSSSKTSATAAPTPATAMASAAKTSPRPAKFIPPPPPPRRLLLTQTNLKTSGIDTKSAPKEPPRQRKYGVFADSGFSVAASAATSQENAIHAANTHAPPCTATTTTTIGTITSAVAATPMATMTTTATATPRSPAKDVCVTTDSLANSTRTASDCASTSQPPPRPSSTIIETSLLSMLDSRAPATSTSSSSGGSSRPPSTSSITASTTRARRLQGQAANCPMAQTAMAAQRAAEQERSSTLTCAPPGAAGSDLSPRLEMRLALNQDIMGDDDLISCEAGPELTTILAQDLSTFQRLTGRDLLNRSATNRVQPKEAVISYSQQRNSKMDTPTVNRRPRPQAHSSASCSSSSNATPASHSCHALNASDHLVLVPASPMPFAGSARVAGAPQHLQPNRNTWSSSASAAPSGGASASGANSSDDCKLSDLEILARREKIYCMSQLRSGSQARTAKTTTMTMTATMSAMRATTSGSSCSQPLMRTTSTTSMGAASEDDNSIGGGSRHASRQRKIGRDESALMEAGKANKLMSFIKRRNSEVPASAHNSQSSLNDSNSSSTPPQHKQQLPMSPRKDNDKPSLNRRLWKQITKRRRSNSVSELVAS